MVYLYPKDEKISKMMERLAKDHVVKVDSNIAKQFGRYNAIRQIRRKDRIYIGKDHTKNKSIILLDDIRIKKSGKKYFFEGL